MAEFDSEAIKKALTERGAVQPCPRCTKTAFSVIEGYFNQVLQQGISEIRIDGRGLPMVAIACSNCGFISQHALGALDLMPSDEPKD